MFNYQGMTEQQVREGVEKFGPAVGSRKIIDQEYKHAMESIQTGIYVTYSCNMKKSECFRVGSTSKCFCGHYFGNHKQQFGKKFNTGCESCPCKIYKFVPIRPEECGMYWLPRRKDFNVTKWRPPCKCNHTCEEHNQNYPLRCLKCQCQDFQSYFACISCDQKWEDHEVLFETEQERKQLNKKVGQDYLPLNMNPDIQEMVFKDVPKQIMPMKPPVGNDKPFPYQKQTQKPQPYTTAFTRNRSTGNKQLK
ncbi:hypothetical protein pb186bvf_014108 [Paramecium bursaria]